MPRRKKEKLIGLGLPANLLKEFIDLSYKGNTSIAPEGYDIDAPLSDSRVKVYQKKGSNQVIIVHRGSVGLQDWYDNAKFFVAGNVKNTKSFKLHEERQRKAVEKYGGENMIGVGHSRAGLYLQQLQKDPETKLNEIITYNKAVGFYDALRTNVDEQTDVKVKNDFVSLLSGLQKRKNKMVEIDATSNPLDFNKAHQAAEIDKLGDTFIGKKEEEKLEGSGRAPSIKTLEELRKKLKTLEKQLINIEKGKVYKTTNKEKVSYEISYTKARIKNHETKGEDLIITKKEKYKDELPAKAKPYKAKPKKEEPKPEEPKQEEPSLLEEPNLNIVLMKMRDMDFSRMSKPDLIKYYKKIAPNHKIEGGEQYSKPELRKMINRVITNYFERIKGDKPKPIDRVVTDYLEKIKAKQKPEPKKEEPKPEPKKEEKWEQERRENKIDKSLKTLEYFKDIYDKMGEDKQPKTRDEFTARMIVEEEEKKKKEEPKKEEDTYDTIYKNYGLSTRATDHSIRRSLYSDWSNEIINLSSNEPRRKAAKGFDLLTNKEALSSLLFIKKDYEEMLKSGEYGKYVRLAEMKRLIELLNEGIAKQKIHVEEEKKEEAEEAEKLKNLKGDLDPKKELDKMTIQELKKYYIALNGIGKVSKMTRKNLILDIRIILNTDKEVEKDCKEDKRTRYNLICIMEEFALKQLFLYVKNKYKELDYKNIIEEINKSLANKIDNFRYMMDSGSYDYGITEKYKKGGYGEGTFKHNNIEQRLINGDKAVINDFNYMIYNIYSKINKTPFEFFYKPTNPPLKLEPPPPTKKQIEAMNSIFKDKEPKKGGYFWESKEVKEEKKAKKIAAREAFEKEKQERRKVRREAVDSFVKNLNEAKKKRKAKAEDDTQMAKSEDNTQMAMEEGEPAIEGGIFGFSAEEKARKQAYNERKAAYGREHHGSTADYVFSKSVRKKFDKEYDAKKNKAQQSETAPKAIESAQQGVEEEADLAIEGGKLTKEGLAQLSKKELHALNKKYSKAFKGQFSKKHKKKGGGIEMFGKLLWSGLSNAPEEIRIQQEAGKVLNGVKVWHLPFWKPADHITEQQAREMVEARAKELGIEALRDKMSKEVGFDVRQMDNNKALGLAFSSALDGLSYTPLGVGASVASSVASQVLDPNLKPLEEKEEEKEGGGFYYLKEIAEPTNPIFKYKKTFEIPTFIDPETEFLLLN